MTDQQLIKGCIQNDRRCQNELYKRYFPLLSSIALRYSKDHDEAIQRLNEGFYKVLISLDKYNHQFALATWIRNILINHLISEFRKEKSYQSFIQLTPNEVVSDKVSINEGAKKLEEEELRALLKKLPPITQEVFNLFAIDGFKHSEIAELLNMAEGTSKWHVNEARKRLKEEINLLYSDNKSKLAINK